MPDQKVQERKEQHQSLINILSQYFPGNVHWGNIPVDTMEPLVGGVLTSVNSQIIESMMRAFRARVHVPDGKTAVLFVSYTFLESINRQGYLISIGVDKD